MGLRHGAARARLTRRAHSAPGLRWRVAVSALVLLMTLLALSAGALLGLVTVLTSALDWYQQATSDLPSATQLASRPVFQTTQIYDRHGTLLYEIYDREGGRRKLVALDEVAPVMIQATLAAEDASFYENPGVDARSVVRAVWQNLVHRDVMSGASTITQQLVRNVLLSSAEREQQTLLRKIREAALALQVNERYTKDEILEMYLNEVYYGDMNYGIGAAAEGYFGKSPRDLTLAEASLLAGLPQSPTAYNPRLHYEEARQRQRYVLEQMVRNGFIDEAMALRAWEEPLQLAEATPDVLRAPHWVFYVRDLLEQKYGTRLLYQGGLQVYTTLDLPLQEQLEAIAKANEANLRARGGSNTAIVAIDPLTGEILAMVGSMDYWNPEIQGEVNVTTALRQPGSSIKPVVYLAAMEKAGLTPGTVLDDSRRCFDGGRGQPPYCPNNYDNTFRGPVTLRTALGNSLNIPAVEALERVGVPAAVEMANRLGLVSLQYSPNVGLSFTLGGAEVKPLELTAAYATLATGGRRLPPMAIRRVLDGHGRVVEEVRPALGEQVVDPRLAYMITSILSDNNARLITYGPNSLLKLSRPAAVKTGTTDNHRDTWTVGYTPNLAIGVWVGNTDGRPMREVLSSMSAGKIWHEAMEASFEVLELPVADFARPDGLVEVQTCQGALCSVDLMLAEQAARLRAAVVPTPGPPTGQ